MNLIQKPSGVWAVDHIVDGKRRRVSTGLKDKAAATKRAREIVLGIDVRPLPGSTPRPGSPEAKGMTMLELFRICQLSPHGPWCPANCRSQRTVKSNLKVLEPMIGHLGVAEVSYAKLQELQVALLARGYANATVKRKMDMVGRALTVAVQTSVIVARPSIPALAVANLQERILEDHEEEAVFACIDKRVKDEPGRPWTRFRHLIRFLLDTGCRLGEPLQATTEWVQAHKGAAVFVIPAAATKTQQGRTVPLSAAIVETLPFLRITSVEGRLFPMSAATAWYMWTNIREDVKAMEGRHLNVDDVKLHTLRHTCLTRLLRAGLALHLVSKWAGHANIKITIERYAKVDAGDLLVGAGLLDSRAAPPALRIVG